MSTNFSNSDREKIFSVASMVRWNSGLRNSAGSGSAFSRMRWSLGGAQRLTIHQTTKISRARPAIIAASTHGAALTASPQVASTLTPNRLSLMNSVMSSLAMWIHHSCGSLMNTQMSTVEMMTVHLPTRAVFQRVRTAS